MGIQIPVSYSILLIEIASKTLLLFDTSFMHPLHFIKLCQFTAEKAGLWMRTGIDIIEMRGVVSMKKLGIKRMIMLLLLGLAILITTVSGATEIPICTNSSVQHYPAISGETIVWEDYRNGNSDIYTWDPLNGEQQVTTNSSEQRYPATSGETIVWQDYRNGNFDIYMWDPLNGEQQVTTNSSDQWSPAILEETIAWQDYSNGNFDIYMWDPVNGEQQVTTNSSDQWYPAISGDTIVWEDDRNGNLDIYAVNFVSIPVASFITDLTSGTAPLSVTFTDTSSDTPTTWNWSFRNVTGNNTQVWFSTEQNPVHTFGVGNYSILLNASNSAGYNLSTQVTFINVTSPSPPPIARFTHVILIPLIAPIPEWRIVIFSDNSTNTPTAWNWSFTNVTGNNTQVWFSTEQNPQHVFGVGNYSILLNASNNAGYNLSTQVTFINVTPLLPFITPTKIGVFRPSAHTFYLRSTFSNYYQIIVFNEIINWGASTDLPVTGDWNNDGTTEVGVFRPSTHTFYLRPANWPATLTSTINWGVSTDLPVTGDWNADGTTEVGVFRPSTHTFYLRPANWPATPTSTINWGVSTDLPVTGEWQTTSFVSDNTIQIKNFAFDPVTITVNVGSTVRWVNQDYAQHRILFSDGMDSNALAVSQSWSRNFDQAGTFDYNCSIHPSMKGTVIVK